VAKRACKSFAEEPSPEIQREKQILHLRKAGVKALRGNAAAPADGRNL